MSSFRENFDRILSTPPVNIEALIKLFNIELDKNAELPDKILGEIRKVDGNYKISVRKNDHYYRKRFTMAHELAHFLLHENKIGDGVDDNFAYRSTGDGNFDNQRITKKEETEANKMAAGLLMPKDLILKSIQEKNIGNNIDNLSELLSKEFQISASAMKIRIASLLEDA